MKPLVFDGNNVCALKERQKPFFPRLQRGTDDLAGSRRFTSGYLLGAACAANNKLFKQFLIPLLLYSFSPQFRFLIVEIVFAQAAVKRRGRNAEKLGGFAAMPVGLFERANNLLALDFMKRKRLIVSVLGGSG